MLILTFLFEVFSLRLILIIFFSFTSLLTFAQQTHFHKHDLGSDFTLSYSWRDSQDANHSLHTQVNKRLAYSKFTDFKRYTPNMAQHHIAHALRLQARAMAAEKIELTVNHHGVNLSYGLRGGTAADRRKWQKNLASLRTNAFNDYINSINHIEFAGFQEQSMVKPDHVKFAVDSRQALVPIARAMREKIPQFLSKRKQIEYLLNFVQSIPYDPLTRRRHNASLAFAPPMSVILQNLGDCDSKATLFAALAKLFYPGGNVAMVILPDHALVAMSLQPTPEDVVINTERGKLVLLEVAGPAVVEPGVVGNGTRKLIASGQYIAEFLPPTQALDIQPISAP